jgi:hypothetical protein
MMELWMSRLPRRLGGTYLCTAAPQKQSRHRCNPINFNFFVGWDIPL